MSRENRTLAAPLQAIQAVFCAFFGVRRRADHEAVKLTPAQVVFAGIAAAALFVAALLVVVNIVLSRAGVAT